MPSQGNKISLYRLAVGDGPGLVQRQPAQLVALLEVGPALDQNALPGRSRQPADDAHRGGNDQRTGTGHNQQYQSPVDPVQPATGHEQRWQHRHGNGQGEDSRGIPAGKAVHETLGRRTAGLCRFHRVNDARQGGLVGRSSDSQLE